MHNISVAATEPTFAVSSLQSIRTQPQAVLSNLNGLTAGTMTRSSSPDRREERFDTDVRLSTKPSLFRNWKC